MAVGDTLAVFDALASRQPSGDHATLNVRGGRPVLDFDDSVDEGADFGGVLPASYASGDLELSITFLAVSSTTGNVFWEASFERIEAGVSDLDVSSFGAAYSATTAIYPVTGVASQSILSIPKAGLSDASAGDLFRIRVVRRATQSADTVLGDVELLAIEVRED